MPTSGRSKQAAGRASKARSVLIAVQPPSLIRLLEHLLHGHPGLRVVGRSASSDALALARRLAPDVIIANTRPHWMERGLLLAKLKRSSPTSTLILLTQAPGEPVARLNGADACLPEDAVVRRLLPLIHRLRDPRQGPGPSSLREQPRSCRP
jgi:DNA-binding NarL/FixJ family response regulator